MKVYVIMETDYQSEAQPCRIWSTREKAEAHVKLLEEQRARSGVWRFPFWNIEEWDVDQ